MARRTGRTGAKAAAIEAMNLDHEAVTGVRPAGFVCPVCREDVDARRATWGHAPAEAVGGRVATLICDRCNSTFGTRFEAAAAKAVIRRRGILAGEWTEDIAIGSGQPGRNPIKAKVRLVRDGSTGELAWHIHGPKPGTSAHARYLEEVSLIVRGGDGSTFKITTKDATNEVIHRAYMSWAFLALTGELGYTFALSEPGRMVADALLSRAFTLFGASAVVNVNGATPDLGFEPSGPVLATMAPLPAAADSFGWRFGPVLCLFALRDDQAGEIYSRMQAKKAVGSWEAVDPDVLRIYLTDPQYAPTPPA